MFTTFDLLLEIRHMGCLDEVPESNIYTAVVMSMVVQIFTTPTIWKIAHFVYDVSDSKIRAIVSSTNNIPKKNGMKK
jgi:membrane protein YdbS with pleckstrin-like domain